MKVLFITLFYPPAHIGGTEIYTHAVARQLQQTGHQVQVLCAENWGQGNAAWNAWFDESYEGIAVRRVCLNWKKARDVNRALYFNPLVALHLQTFLREWQPDLVHVTSCQTLSASVITAAKQAGIPVVVTLTDFWFLCPRVTLRRSDGQLCDGRVDASVCLDCMLRQTKAERWSKALLPHHAQQSLLTRVSQAGWLTRGPGLRGLALNIEDRRETLHQALRQADSVIAPSHFVKTAFRQNDFDVAIDVIPHGNDLAWAAPNQTKTASKAIRFGYIGQILPIKGVHCLIDAFQRLPKHVSAELHIYGSLDKDAVYVASLREQARDNLQIYFNGPFQRAALGRVFAGLDVLVVPSLWHETYGLVIQEAFAAHTPVIASAVGAIPEFVHDNVNGLVFEMGNVQELARQMQRVIDEPTLLPRLRDGILPVKDIQAEVAQVLNVYARLLARTHDATTKAMQTEQPN